MLREIKELQSRAVSELVVKAATRRELTFRAPTGSGKTHMMADLMNRVLQMQTDVVFLVSSLSKGGLAEQNYQSFMERQQAGMFTNLNPYLISSETGDEETLYIPTGYNVYVLPRDLFKKNGRLMAGPMTAFLQKMTEGRLFGGMGKRIWLIKDECHQATNNLDALSVKFFEKTFNFSATPKLSRRQVPDVQISDDEAVQARLIKRIEFGPETDTLDDALRKFEEIKWRYTSLDVTPCLIIQISNKEKAEEEWQRNIRPVLDKMEHQSLKWMLIVDKEKDCDTNDDLKKLKVSKWKEYAKRRNSTIDVIVFKMVISEGWDIPRACMLYQVRDTQSRQLDEQVMGRVRRNPRLLDFERLDAGQQELATTAWIWGVAPQERTKSVEVTLWDEAEALRSMPIKTIHLKPFVKAGGSFADVAKMLDGKPQEVAYDDIFTLHQKLQSLDSELQDFCYAYADGSAERWMHFLMNVAEVKKRYNRYICDYDESMEVDERTVSFPPRSYYLECGNTNMAVKNWVWRRTGRAPDFDSVAEREWAGLLQQTAEKYGMSIESEDVTTMLWGKNFPPYSEIRYEYYDGGVHASYPDFLLKDRNGRIHLFEVKSVNVADSSNIDKEEYEAKVRRLKECYRACSRKLPGYLFYLPLLKGDMWQITRFRLGVEDLITEEEFLQSLELNAEG